MRPIDADALLELARNHVGHTVDCNDIARFPTIDAEPVRHGRWIPTEIHKSFGTLNGFKCSLCHKERMSRENYCPNCGAKMMEVQ